MKKHLVVIPIIVFYTFLGHQSLYAVSRLYLIPQPESVELTPSFFDLTKPVLVETNLPDTLSTHFLQYLKNVPLHSNITTRGKLSLQLWIDNKDTSFSTDEAYNLIITHRSISIRASSDPGIFYGIQTLLQLIQFNTYGNKLHKLPTLIINDRPRFAYRGMHLDVSRNFFPVDFIKKQLDMMAYYKLNRFHWHLTDGPGWRIEIKRYPLLTNVAAWRKQKNWKDWWASDRHYVNKNDSSAYGGYYSQDQIRDIVNYATKRYITIIPEIEMPAHSEEVLAVYPQLSCSGTSYTNSVFCIGNEDTYQFLENALTEVIALFPSKYIHIGGDEADKTAWKTCPKCQARMKTEHLTDVDELQSYLIHRIEKFLNSKGRKLLGWDEMLQGGLAPNAAVMSWRGEDGGISAVKSNHEAIMAPGEYCYFDHYQADPATQPEAIGGYLPLEKVYSYNPVPSSLSTSEAKLILGIEACLWTEYIPTPEHAEYMTYPRLLALSEVGWSSPQQKFWQDFKQRVNKHIPFLLSKGYHPFTLSDEVTISHIADYRQKKLFVQLEAEKYPAEIHYTLDGTKPVAHSPLYRNPIPITDSKIISAQLFKEGKALGKETSQ
jgi:hexosaminidase